MSTLTNPLSARVDPGDQNDWQAQDHGLLSWSYDPSIVTNSAVPTSGVTYAVRLKVAKAMSITNIHLVLQAAGTNLTTGQNFAGLFQGGVLLGITADMSTTWNSTATTKFPLAGGPFAVAAGDIQIAYFCNNTAGTNPSFLRNSGFATGHNVNLTATTYRYATADTGRTTTFATPMGTLSSLNVAIWAGVS